MRRRQFLQRLAGLALGVAVLPGALAEAGPTAVSFDEWNSLHDWPEIPRGKVPWSDEPFWSWLRTYVHEGWMTEAEYRAERRKWGYSS